MLILNNFFPPFNSFKKNSSAELCCTIDFRIRDKFEISLRFISDLGPGQDSSEKC